MSDDEDLEMEEEMIGFQADSDQDTDEEVRTVFGLDLAFWIKTLLASWIRRFREQEHKYSALI